MGIWGFGVVVEFEIVGVEKLSIVSICVNVNVGREKLCLVRVSSARYVYHTLCVCICRHVTHGFIASGSVSQTTIYS